MAKKTAEFQWGPLSVRQTQVLTWWRPGSVFADYNGIIADGAIRSGKTVSMAFSFVLWAMEKFSGQNFALCGKTIASLRRNVIKTLKRQLSARGYEVRERRADNLLIVSSGEITNDFYLFGGKDEGSQDLIQGITLAGIFFDEVALMPESFVNQATARCSVKGSTFWFNCNPEGPFHWFYLKWVLRCRKRRLVYLHFEMDDNLTLSEEIKARYRAQYAGVFFLRFIRGLWAAAEGLIFDMFSREMHVLKELPETSGDMYVSCDFGMQNPTAFLLWQKETGTERWICLREYYYSGREEMKQKTVAEYADDLMKWLGGAKIRKVIADPSAKPLIVELKRRGLSVMGADNDVSRGISDVAVMLNTNRLAFDAGCRRTIQEFGSYMWDAKAAEHGDEQPVKANDHAMDAVRYFVRTKRLVKPAEKYTSVFERGGRHDGKGGA